MIRVTFPLGVSIVLCAAFARPASTQFFEQVSSTKLTQISAGGTTVWGVDASGLEYRFNPSSFVFDPVASFVKQVAVGGGTLVQSDDVWLLEPNDAIFRASRPNPTMSGDFVQVTGFLSQIAVGAGYIACHPYEVWGVNSLEMIYRYNYCSGAFEEIPGILSQIAVGDGQVWGLNSFGMIYRFNPSTNLFIEVPGILSQIAVGAAGVWGVGPGNLVYRFNEETGSFNEIEGQLTQIAVGGNGVWGLNAAGMIYRFDESTQSFTQIPGALSTISVGTGTGVWGISSSNLIYAVFSLMLNEPLSGTGAHTVDLSWHASTSTVAGYNVYRSVAAGGPYTKLNLSLITGTSYIDSAVQAGQTFYYVATALDANNNESAYSNQATAVVPSP